MTPPTFLTRRGRKPQDADLEKPRPLDESVEDGRFPADPTPDTGPTDEEGGADPIDPDTGLPYDDNDPGEDAPRANQQGGTSDS